MVAEKVSSVASYVQLREVFTPLVATEQSERAGQGRCGEEGGRGGRRDEAQGSESLYVLGFLAF